MSKSRTLLIALAVLMIASLACSVGSPSTPTSVPVPTTEPTVEEPPTAIPAPTSTRAPTPKPVATTAATPALPNGVLLNDDFSSQQASEDKGWAFDSGEGSSWSWSDNRLALSIKKKQWIGYNSPDGTFDDFGAEVEAQATSSQYAEYGIRFRADKDNYYIFAVSTTGQYYLQKKVDGQWVTPDPVKSTASDYIKKGKTKNTLAVLAQGSKISLYINGFLVKTVTDDSIASGFAGVFGATGDNDSTEVAFSRFTILTADKAKADWGTTPSTSGGQPTPASGGGGGGATGVLVRNTFPGACQANLWGKKEAVIRAEGNSSKFMALPAGTYGIHLAVDIGEVDLVQFTVPAGVTCVITCDKATKSVYNSCR